MRGGDRLVQECSWMNGICFSFHHSTYCCGDFKRSPPLISQPCRFRSAVKSGSFPPGEAKNSEDFGEYHTSKHSVAWKAAAPLGSPIRRPLQLAVQNHNVLPFNLRHSLSQREPRRLRRSGRLLGDPYRACAIHEMLAKIQRCGRLRASPTECGGKRRLQQPTEYTPSATR